MREKSEGDGDHVRRLCKHREDSEGYGYPEGPESGAEAAKNHEMIRITYEYDCDFCGEEVLPPQTNKYCGGMVPLVPDRVTLLGRQVICPICEAKALKGIAYVEAESSLEPMEWTSQ